MGKIKKIRKLDLNFAAEDRVSVSSAVLDQALKLYEAGKYVDAYHAASQAGPLKRWKGADAQTFGFRLANNLGAERLASLLICRARREDPKNAEGAVHYGYYLRSRRGAFPAWRHCMRAEALPSPTPAPLADLKAMRATIAAGYRDFGTAWRLWNEAVSMIEPSAWLHVEKGSILLSEERRDEALAAFDEALALRPWFRPAVQFRARLLHLLGRWEEAIGFLTESMQHLQSCAAAAQLMSLMREVDDHAGMEELAGSYRRLAILGDANSDEWLACRRVDLLMLRGDHAGAATIAAKLSDEYHAGLAGRLDRPGVVNVRKRLTFEFVHQKHNTCAPATLAAAAHFWKKPITMEQIADAICYDGTYDHSERSWAVANGFVAREFTVTWDAATQLIDRGVPFVLHTVEVGSAHAQAVIGYDLLRETLFIQDPSEPHYREVEAVEFLAAYRLTGPGGLVIAPLEKAKALDELLLPDAEAYDINHRFNAALASYDRDAAVHALGELEAHSPEHRLTLIAQMSLAGFDGNEVERLICINRLLKDFPGDPRLLNWKYQALRSMGSRNERLKLLRDMTRTENPPAEFCKNLIGELMDDARDWDEARLLAWRSHARFPGDAGLIISLAEVMRRMQRAAVDEWLTCHRFAAALADKVESVAQTWFVHSQSQGQAEQALDWLRKRWRNYGTKSGGPALTLAQALDAMCLPEALAVLREAVVERPEDGDLLLNLSRMEARAGNHEQACDLLNRAKGRCPPGQWQRANVSLMRRFGDHTGEMAAWRQILTNEPLALDAHGWVARELAATRGHDAAVGHLAEICARFPYHYGLAQIHISWLRDGDLQQAANEIQRVTAMHPADPWAHRELALTLRDMGRLGEAVAPAREAVMIAPDQAASHAVLGLVLASDGRNTEAADHFHAAIRLDVNSPAAFDGLLSVRSGTMEQRESLGFIRGEMIRQVLNGNALHSYQSLAFTTLTPDELLAELREIWHARPDLWEAWSVLIAQMIDSDHKDEAVSVAQQATQKFALIPGAWRDMALVWRSVARPDAAIACARHAVSLNPDWAEGWCLLAEYLEDSGQGAEAIQRLETASARLPLDMSVRRVLALLLWRMDRREEAWQLAEAAAREDPAQNWAWACMQNWADVLQRNDRPIAAARKLTQERTEDARSWFILARLLPLERISDILAALDQTISLNPRLTDAYDVRMEMLARLGRLDEADATPARGPWGTENIPHSLSGRLAWLQAVRGNLPEAMRRIRLVLDKHRDYYWGWEMYSQWAEQRKDSKEWKRAAAEMIRLAPRSPGAHCCAADVALHCGERETGIMHLSQALQVDSSSPYAAQRLLGLYWEKRDIEGLKKAAAMLPSTGMPALISRVHQMLAAAHQDDLKQARVDLAWLAEHPDAMGPMLNLIADFFLTQKRKHAPVLDEALNTAASNGTIGPAFAILWVLRETQHMRWHCWDRLAQWMPRLGSRLDAAIAHYLDATGDARAAEPHVSHFIQACGPQLRQRGELWSKVSYALASNGAFRACADWMENDYLRDDAEGWALWNLSFSLRQILRPEKAEDVSIYVVTQGIRDTTWLSHVSVASLGLAWRQNYQAAAQLLKDNPVKGDEPPGDRLLLLMAQALCDVMTMPPVAGRARFKLFLSGVRPLLSTTAVSLQDKRDFDRAVELMRKHTGAMLMPWQKPKAQTERWQSSQGQSTGSRIALIVGMLLFINMIRQCGSSTDYSRRRPSDAKVEELLRQVRSQAPPSDGAFSPSPDLKKLIKPDKPGIAPTIEAPLLFESK